MRKSKLFSAIAVLLCLCMLFVACSKKEPEEQPTAPTPLLEQILNKDLQSNYVDMTKVTNLGKADDGESLNSKLYIFYEGAENGDYLQKIFSSVTGTIILTLTEKADSSIYYYVEAVIGNAFIVQTYDSEKDDECVKTQLYNAKGEEIASVDEEMYPEELTDYGYIFGISHFLFNNVLYQASAADGSVVKIADIPDYMHLPYIDAWNDQYYFGSNEYSDGEYIKIYNKQFKLLYVWEAPSYAENTVTGLLNNGNIVAQYFVALPNDAVEYDVFYENTKYDMVTVIVNPADGKTEAIDVNFVIEEIISVASYKQMIQIYTGVDYNIFAEGVENIATIAPIEGKNINFASEASDYVLMSNTLECGMSMKFVPGQDLMGTAFPAPAGNGLYVVYADGNMVLLNSNAEEIARFSEYECSTLGTKYFYTDDAIYDLSTMAKVYDLKAEKAEIVEEYENSLLISVEKDDKTAETYIWQNGEKILLATYNEETGIIKDASGKTVVNIDVVDGCYRVIVMEYEDGKFDYYSTAGKKLFTSDKELYCMDYFWVMEGLNQKYIALFSNEDGAIYLFS